MVRANRRITLEEIEDGLNEDCSHFSKNTLGDRNDEVKEEVDKWLKEAAGEWYNTGITKLVDRMKKVIEHQGDYVEKEQTAAAMTSRYLAFISLSIGFLIIWTAFLSGVLVSRTYKDDTISQHSTDLFMEYEDLGQITFVLGHELVSMVDWLLVNATSPVESLHITWQTTDQELQSIGTRRTGDGRRSSPEIPVLTRELEAVRKRAKQPIDAIRGYQSLMTGIAAESGRRHEQQTPAFAYSLFIQGMAQRFTELALTTIYLNDNRPELVELHGSSQKLMEAAFSFSPRTRLKWAEMQQQVVETGHYLNDVRKHLTFLLLAKENRKKWKIQNKEEQRTERRIENFEEGSSGLTGFEERVSRMGVKKHPAQVERGAHHTRNTLAFHVSLAVVAVTAILLCLIVMAVSCSYLGASKAHRHNRDSVYSNSDKSHILPQDFHPKPQCYL
ncbi:hypothetical protein LAZ67_1001144 [Cordylochernes scorpioides]|uniref:Uncharacterized protein n=1 Tax=Cordylochernes scorpioides TaxID=51811 RepID=A0ABY6JW79_9ARAC|nr:hypothetical protein LAZ67_1001144 [Cordylochernes scorpioides]